MADRELARFRPRVKELQPNGFSVLQIANAVAVFESITIPEHQIVSFGEVGPTTENILATIGFLCIGANALLPNDRRGRRLVTTPPREIGLRELKDATRVFNALKPEITYGTTSTELRDPADPTPEKILDEETVQLVEKQLAWRTTLAEDIEGEEHIFYREPAVIPIPGDRRRTRRFHQRIRWHMLGGEPQTDDVIERRRALAEYYRATTGKDISEI